MKSSETNRIAEEKAIQLKKKNYSKKANCFTPFKNNV